VDLAQVEAAAKTISEHARSGAVVLIRSTVPVGTSNALQLDPLAKQLVVSNPEFLREGHALADVLAPSRIVAGGPEGAHDTVSAYYAAATQATGCELYWTDARTAELSKYASNAFLATKLSFVNEIANLAAALHADGATAIRIMAADPRIGAAFTRPGIGWGGSCFPKDTRALHALAAESNYPFVLLSAVIQQNRDQLAKFVDAILRRTRRGDAIAVLGRAFKPLTSDTRESPALELARALTAAGRSVVAFDPAVPSLPDDPAIRVARDAYSAVRSADAVAIATDWAEFADLDLPRLRAEMRGALLFDGRGQITPRDAEAAGFSYVGASS
jgi:UDPglucose 6-dehydrogenase